jgi:hypothetical protein
MIWILPYPYDNNPYNEKLETKWRMLSNSLGFAKKIWEEK